MKKCLLAGFPELKVFALIILIFLNGCKKDDSGQNQNPNCEISSPLEGENITHGTIVNFSVNASDPDGSIREVRFYIDGNHRHTDKTYPYAYEWYTGDDLPSQQVLKSTAIDNEGSSASDEVSITIVPGPGNVIADFSATPAFGLAPLNVSFKDLSSASPDSWFWNFGDGYTSLLQNPNHTYNSTGIFSVTLVASNTAGADTILKESLIKVQSPVFMCGDLLIDNRDNQLYTTVLIDTQCWMAENLNIGNRIDGYIRPKDNSVIEKHCYGDSISNCEEYGGLYKWDEAMGYSTAQGAKGICPEGWHIPTNDEWCTLTTFLDSSVNCSSSSYTGTDIGIKMMEAGYTHWKYPHFATNSSGFTALGAGLYNYGFINKKEDTFFWTSSTYYTGDPYYRTFHHNYPYIKGHHGSLLMSVSVRCLKD